MLGSVDPVVEALAVEHAELAGLLGGLSETQWSSPTRCVGWDVSDVVLHLAQSDAMAIVSARGTLGGGGAVAARTPEGAGGVDDVAAAMVERERGLSEAELLTRWTACGDELVEVLDSMDLSTRVGWVAGDLSARTLATTRQSETWIHAGDVADAVGLERTPTDRLWFVTRLAWRTLPYAFATAGLAMAGPVSLRLDSPGGATWNLVPDEVPATTIEGSAEELCEVAAQRLDPDATSLTGSGPDVHRVLTLIRTYA